MYYSTQYNNTPAGLIRIVFTSVYIWVLCGIFETKFYIGELEMHVR